MKPDSIEWWQNQAQLAKDRLREEDTPENCCLYALAAGRCKLISKNSTKWPFTVKRAVQAATGLIEIINDFKSRLGDISWLLKLWPEKIKDVTPIFINRRLDILGVQVMLDIAFDEIEVKYETLVNETTDNVVNALLDLDMELEKVMPALHQLGHGDKIIAYHRGKILKQFQDQWWLTDTVKDKTK